MLQMAWLDYDVAECDWFTGLPLIEEFIANNSTVVLGDDDFFLIFLLTLASTMFAPTVVDTVTLFLSAMDCQGCCPMPWLS
jgi:hypothetical protein